MYGGLSPASGESMLTGSPQSGGYASPLNFPGSGSPKTPYLPPYLLGPTHQTPAESQRNFQNYAGQFQSPSMTSHSGHHHVTWSPDLIQRIPAASTSSVNRFGGPPTRSLELFGSQKKEQNSSIPLERLDSAILTTSPAANLSAAQVDPFYTQGEDFDPAADLDDTWVTVFGFPPDSANYILKEFSTYGTIIQHEFASKGNWVHIRYQSPMQARKASAKNGHLYAQNTIRIGVSPCIDKDIMRRYRRKKVLQSDADDAMETKRFKTSPSAPPKPDITPVPSHLFTSYHTSTPARPSPLAAISRFDHSGAIASPMDGLNRSARLSSMRSLAAAYDTAGSSTSFNQSEHQSAVNGTNGNLLSKAWKYIFNS